jgi:hypothetical protein
VPKEVKVGSAHTREDGATAHVHLNRHPGCVSPALPHPHGYRRSKPILMTCCRILLAQHGSDWLSAPPSHSQLAISYQWRRAPQLADQCRASLVVTATGMEDEAHVDGGAGVTWPSNQVVGEVRARARDHRQCAWASPGECSARGMDAAGGQGDSANRVGV